MPVTTDIFYVVCTFKHMLEVKDYTPYVNEFLETQFPLKSYCVVLETGKNGDNPHLNFVLHYQKPRRSDHVRSSFYSLLYKKIQDDYQPTKYDVCVKKCVDVETLLGGYLQKESTHTVLVNQGYDLPAFKEKLRIKPSVKVKTFVSLTNFNAVEYISRYASENEMDIVNADTFLDVIYDMSTHGYNIVPIIPHLNNIGKVIVGMSNPQFLKNYLKNVMMVQDNRLTTQQL